MLKNANTDCKSSVPRDYFKGARHNLHQKRRHNAVLEIIRTLKGNVLDYGCGYGDLTYAISKTHPVCGVDIDPDRIAFAKAEYSPLSFELCTDAPCFPDKSFDIITSIMVADFIEDVAKHLQQLRRLLRDEGYLIIACENVPYLHNCIRRCFGRGPVVTGRFTRSRMEMEALLEKANFSIVGDSYFYDPPFISWKNFGDVIIGSISQFLSLLRVRKTADYYIVIAKINPDSPPKTPSLQA